MNSILGPAENEFGWNSEEKNKKQNTSFRHTSFQETEPRKGSGFPSQLVNANY